MTSITTREEILTMPASRDMDAFIHNEFFGINVFVSGYVNLISDGSACRVNNGGQWDTVKLPYYSEKIQDAWKIIETQAQQYHINSPSDSGNVACMIQIRTKQGMAKANDVPLAICRAALLAKLG